MFTQPVASPPPGPPSTSPATALRSSRLRGLSYLRNYTHSHLLSRDSQHHAAPSSLTRSARYSLAAPAPSHRLTLVSSPPDATRASPSEPVPEAPARHASPSPQPRQPPRAAPMAVPAPGGDAPAAPNAAPSIRFSAYYDHRSSRPSLSFAPVSRTLPVSSDVIRVGRYSERDGQAAAASPAHPSAAPVGFKSKVVSRRHCEFWYQDGKWYIRDVKSSSGTFLNHIRLSPPSQESRAYVVNDGDIVQLGIDFKGGEEMIFRCVKMRLELNRGWQKKLNTFK